MFAGSTCFNGTLAANGPDKAAPAGTTKKLGFDPGNMDKTCQPCEDFNQFANGGWIQRTQMPGEFPRWGSFIELQESNTKNLHLILEEVSKNTKAKPGSQEQQIGDFYAAAMDEAKIEAAGATALKADLEQIASIKDGASVQAVLAGLHTKAVRVAFFFGAGPDFKNSSVNIAQVGQGGLGLPDKDYYFKEDEKSKNIRAEYVKYATKLFTLLGDDAATAETQAKSLLAFETKLAGFSLNRVERRDPSKQYNKKTLAELKTLTPNFDWDAYFKTLGVAAPESINVGQPKFLEGFNGLLATASTDEWKAYFRGRLIDGAANFLSKSFVDASFEFNGRILNGTTENQPRWKRMTQLTDRLLGDSLGQIYVKRHFSPQGKAKVKEMLVNIRFVLKNDIQQLPWMSQATRDQALAKLNAIEEKIGYPDKWKDYSSIKITRNSFLENVRACGRYAIQENLKKLGKPVDRTEWGMTPPTVNAYYNPLQNEIAFPAGILQSPFYSADAEDAVNYGGIGAVIGHEITHGFDDSGRQFDKDGNLKDWWTSDDAKNYKDRATCVETQYSGYKVDDLNVNGKLVLGESIADLGGLTLAYLAYQHSVGGKPGPVIDGFTAEQRFFMGWAQVWRTKARPEFLRLQIATDPHPPAQFRVNGTVSNMEEFAKAFGCKKGDKMVRESLCRIW
ncbi:MAG: M13 family metallopeptidase [Blastocatellia bacterium]|nr:M13 family metallopeptidase [Blastocatellia bacterium]